MHQNYTIPGLTTLRKSRKINSVGTKTLTQMKDSTSVSGAQTRVEEVGNVTPGTGDVLVSQPQFEPTNVQGTSVIAPSFIRAVGASSSSIQSGQGHAGPSETVETRVNPRSKCP